MTDSKTCECDRKQSPTLRECDSCGKPYRVTDSNLRRAQDREWLIFKGSLWIFVPIGLIFFPAFMASLFPSLHPGGVSASDRLFFGILGMFAGAIAAGLVVQSTRWLLNSPDVAIKLVRLANIEADRPRREREAKKRRSAAEKAAIERDVESGLLLADYKNRPVIRFDEKTSRLSFYTETGSIRKSYYPKDIVSVEIIDDQNTITSTDRGSQIAGALVGGALLGGVGAIVGGLSGSKNAEGKCEQLSLKVVVEDTTNPNTVVTLLRRPAYKKTGWPRYGYSYKYALRQAEHWHGKISVLMKQAQDANAPAAEGGGSVATELERLKKLHAEGDLNEREYAAAKARVLGE
jgi:hypothetical protein